MSYEKRAVRPFDTLDRTQRLLNRMMRVQCPPIPDGYQTPLGNAGLELLGVKDGSIAASGGTLVLNPEQYVGDAIGLYFSTHDDDWQTLTKEAGKELDQIFGRRDAAPVSVIVTLNNTRLKQIEILSSMTFSEWASGDWKHLVTKRVSGDLRPRPLRMPGDGCVLGIRFMLHSDLPVEHRVGGRPWRKGNWLARVDINISSASGGGLLPRPMNDAIRARFQLGEQTTLFVEFRGDRSGLHAVTDLSDVLSVYVDEDLLMAALETDARNAHVRPAGQSLVNRWVLDTYRTLIEMYSRDDQLDDFDPTSDVYRRTFLYSMLLKVEDHCHVPIEEALLILKDQPNRFAALFEHVLNAKQSDQFLLGLRK
jgi:hypothetical protein